ncbi:Hint domain-containing protein [Gemmobacter serpentinus]|uniref:Hint domain-containing protein n=1 Tax=Gemmobacter serpentinus TaxID=2652247 RepID=UPI00124C3210|nr:Hint domain-containing protein [Gemmobacter serpentinus]
MPTAQALTIDTDASAMDMANAIFGNGITVQNAWFEGDPLASGVYSGALTTIPGVSPTDTGVILSTGNVRNFTNDSGTTDTNSQSAITTDLDHGVEGDPGLDGIAGVSTHDGAILNVDFIPDGDMITMNFVFSSDEYPEYVNSGVNDAFGVWVNGVLVPATIAISGTVSIDTVNSGSNQNLYVDNTQDQYNTEMDGFTYVLSIKAKVNPGELNSLRIGIADGGDSVVDSNLLIMGESIQTYTLAFDDEVNVLTNETRTFDILANDDHPEGSNLTITQINGQDVVPGQTVTLQSGHQVQLNADGTVTVFSNGETGSEAFSYTVDDGMGNKDVGYVTMHTAATASKDGIVSGTSGDDRIDGNYVGDPDGDLIDSNDATGLNGSTGNDDIVYGGAGNDTIYAGEGDDSVSGGADNDLIHGGAGNDLLAGDEGDDHMYGDAGDDVMLGGIGNDTLYGGEGEDTLRGGAGDDHLHSGSATGNSSLDGGEGNDTLEAGAYDDTLDGGAGDDYLFANTGNDLVYGGEGNDTILSGPGDDTLYGGAGDDSVWGHDDDDLAYGGDGNDTLAGHAGNDTLLGEDGNDLLTGGTGNDLVQGGAGDDVIYGDEPWDTGAGAAPGSFSFGLFALNSSNMPISNWVTYVNGTATFNGAADAATIQVSDDDPALEDHSGGGGSPVDANGNQVLTSPVTITKVVSYTGSVPNYAQVTFPAGTPVYAVAQSDIYNATTGETGNAWVIQIGSDNTNLFYSYDIAVQDGDVITWTSSNDPAVQSPIFADVTGLHYTDLVQADGNMAPGHDDTLEGGDGNDTIYGGQGSDILTGGAGNDLLTGGAGDDSLDGGDGNDTLQGGAGNDALQAGKGADSLDGGDGADVLYGGGDSAGDTLSGGSDADTIYGHAGDVVIGGEGVTTGEDNDLLIVSDVREIVYGGGDNEAGTIHFNDGGSLTFSEIERIEITGAVDGTSGNDSMGVNYADGQGDQIDGSDGIHDTIFGYGGNDTINAGLGNDLVFGGEGDDGVFGLDGDDTIYGETGDDTLIGGKGNDLVYGGADADTVRLNEEDGTDTLFGGSTGDDHDTLDMSLVDSGVNISFSGDESGSYDAHSGTTGGFFDDFENFQTGAGNDGIYATSSNADLTISTGAGNDEVLSGGGHDTIDGGAGNDLIYGGDGNDSLMGNDGDDYMEGGTGNDTLSGDEGNDFVRGDAGNDTVYGGAGDDSVYGGADDDHVYGGDGNDEVYGGFGTDTVYGGAGNDTITGSGGDDEVHGDDGDDIVKGSDGADTLYGGAGADTLLGEDDADVIYGGGGDFVDGGETVTTGTDDDTLIVNDVSHIVFDPINAENGTVHFNDGSLLEFINIEHVIADGNVVVPPNYIVEGTDGDDTIDADYTGDPQGDRIDAGDNQTQDDDDLVQAGGGNDVVASGAGDDTVYGGTGDDTVAAGAGNDLAYGEEGDDVLSGGLGDDTLDGGIGNDTLNGDAGNDSLIGGEGDDSLNGGAGDDTIAGDAGNDSVAAGDGDDLVSGGDGDDTLIGQGGSDTIAGGEGNDLIYGGADEAAVPGGLTVWANDPSTIYRIDIDENGVGVKTAVGPAARAYGDIGMNADGMLYGTSGGTLYQIDTTTGAETLIGPVGNYAGNNALSFGYDGMGYGAYGSSIYRFDPAAPANSTEWWTDPNGGYPAGDFLFVGDSAYISWNGYVPEWNGYDYVPGSTYATQLIKLDLDADGNVIGQHTLGTLPDTAWGLALGPNGEIYGVAADPSTGQNGLWQIDVPQGPVANPTQPVPLTLVSGSENGTTYWGATSNYEAHLGGGADEGDLLDGGAGNDTIHGGFGNDTLIGGTGNDLLYGGQDNDSLSGGEGDDTLEGGVGDDSLSGGIGNDQLFGGDGDDQLSGDAGEDQLYGGAGNDQLDGGAGNDTLSGDEGDDTLLGEDGDDSLDGGAGNDVLYGGIGDDQLSGGDGDDSLAGGAGNDTLNGGAGADTLTGGDDRDLFTGVGIGDVIDGSEGGDDYDILDLSDWGPRHTNIIYDPTNSENGVVEFLDDDGNVIGSMTFSNIEQVIPCFTPGSLIATAEGEIPVEALQVGDMVLTRDNGYQQVRWVGRRDLSAAELARNPNFAPVRIAKGALGAGLPQRDMMVSPQHRMLMTSARSEMYFGEREVLVAATHLAGQPGISQLPTEGISYIHVAFAQHEIIRADGAWTESFQPGDLTLAGMDDAQRNELLALFPGLLSGAVIPAARRCLKGREARVLLSA